MNNQLMLPWLAELILITFRGFTKKTKEVHPVSFLPVPADFTATFIVFGALAFIPGQWQRPATIFGWGVVIATAFNVWDPTTGKLGSSSSGGGQTTQGQAA